MTIREGAQNYRVLTLGALLAVFALSMALRLYSLDGRSLRSDELFTAWLVQFDLNSIVHQTAEDIHPPLWYAITRFFVVLFGDEDFVLRLPAAFFGAMSVLVVFKLGEALWTSREGLVAAALLAISPYHVLFSQFARFYALWIFLSSLSLLLLLKALQSGKKRLWVGFTLSAALSIYNVYLALFPLAGQALFGSWSLVDDLLSRTKASRNGIGPTSPAQDLSLVTQAVMLLMSLALVALSFVPWLPVMARQLSGENIRLEGLAGQTMPGLNLSLDNVHIWLRRYSGVDGVALALFLVLLAIGFASCTRKQVLPIAFTLAMAAAFPLLVRATHQFRPEYVLFTLPLLLLVVARGMVFAGCLSQRALRRPAAPAKHLALLTPLLALVVFWYAGTPYLRGSYDERENWRGAAQYLAGYMLPGDAILADGRDYRSGRDHGRVIRGLPRYLDYYGIRGEHFLRAGRGIWLDLRRVEQRDASLWTVIWYPNRPADWDTQNQITIVDFEGISVMRLRESSGDIVQDTVSMLHLLPDLLPIEASFTVHLALAELYLRTGQSEQAGLQLDMAARVKPHHAQASRDLAATGAELQELYSSTENMQHPLWRNFDGVLAFLGYRIHPTSIGAGATLEVTFWWQTWDAMDRDYTVFIHMIGPDDRIWAQEDRLLQHGDYPTSTWLPGETVKGEYELQLPADAPPGEYTVKMGIYYWETGERLPVWNETGDRAAENAILLGSITVDD